MAAMNDKKVLNVTYTGLTQFSEIDDKYNPESRNPQSGVAVAEAVEPKADWSVVQEYVEQSIAEAVKDKATLEPLDIYYGDISMLYGETVDGIYKLENVVKHDETIVLTFNSSENSVTFKLLSSDLSKLDKFKSFVDCKCNLIFTIYVNPNTQEKFYEVKITALKDVSDKQNKLVAGDNITIDENNVISASCGGTGGSITVDQTYKSTSSNAQSGKAVAEAIADVKYVEFETHNVLGGSENTSNIQGVWSVGIESVGIIDELYGDYTHTVYLMPVPNGAPEPTVVKFSHFPYEKIEANTIIKIKGFNNDGYSNPLVIGLCKTAVGLFEDVVEKSEHKANLETRTYTYTATITPYDSTYTNYNGEWKVLMVNQATSNKIDLLLAKEGDDSPFGIVISNPTPNFSNSDYYYSVNKVRISYEGEFINNTTLITFTTVIDLSSKANYYDLYCLKNDVNQKYGDISYALDRIKELQDSILGGE